VRVTVSIGATMAAPGETPDDLVDRADRFMYASKRGGRNRVTTDSGELTSKAGKPILGADVPWETPMCEFARGRGVQTQDTAPGDGEEAGQSRSTGAEEQPR
jgi:hypothetical protein